MTLSADDLELLPSRLSLADLLPASLPARGRSRRRIWRGVDGGQSVLVLQVMGQLWARWNRWGELRDQVG